MPIHRRQIILIFAILATHLGADACEGNTPTLLDAYLAQAAVKTIAYRTDLQPGGDPRTIPPGRLFGISPLIGPFTYRPKTCEELAPAERVALIRDPECQSFLIAARGQRNSRQISVPADEMLRPRPVVITLPPPPDVP